MWEDNSECIEGVENFKYLGLMLDRLDKNLPTVFWNTGKVRQVWDRQGKLLRREGEEPRVSEMFYREVVQAVLIFGSETWILSAEIYRKL